MKPEDKKKLMEVIGAILGVGMVLLVGYIVITHQASQVAEICKNVSNCTLIALN